MSSKEETLHMLQKCKECSRPCKTYSVLESAVLYRCPDFTPIKAGKSSSEESTDA